jgi:outer membrane protein TolC
MKRMIVIISTLLSTVSYAQTTLTLQQAIALGLKNRYDMQANQYDINITQTNINRSKTAWIPDINADAEIRYNTRVQATYIPQGFGSLDKPELLALGAKNATILGLNLNQPLYKPQLSTSLKIARNEADLQREKNREAEINIKTLIARAYLNVLLKEAQQKIAANDEQRYEKYYTLADGKYQAGSLIENDYLHAKLDYENAKVQYRQSVQNYSLAIDELKYQVNIPAGNNIVIVDTLSKNALPDLQPISGDATNRTEIKQLLLSQQGNQLQLKMTKQNVLPVVSFFANYSGQFVNNNFNYSKSEWWSSFSYLGLRVAIPLTANFKNHHDLLENRMRIQQTALNIKQKTADINYEITKAATERNNALNNLQEAGKNYELSQTIYQNQLKQFALGSFQYNNLLDTEKSISTVEQNYIMAIYDYLNATINLQKANGGL